mmetsp:Transcript_77908/g.114011  ORF Transcript_77908/g.114011 Transcript_77908/m.114011 type:complete len:84 (+) Transcript_77908:60-311(+)
MPPKNLKAVEQPEEEEFVRLPSIPRPKPMRCKVAGAGSKSYNGTYMQSANADKFLSSRNGAPQLVLISKVCLVFLFRIIMSHQ